MSSISMDIPTFHIDDNDLQNLNGFLYKHEAVLREYGAIKLDPKLHCKLALKKRRKNLVSSPSKEQIVKMNKDESIYFVETSDYINQSIEENLSIKDESTFWSSLSSSKNKQRQINISFLPEKSFFSEKSARFSFDIHHVPVRSILRLGGRQLTRQFIPCVRRAHGPGAIFPLTCAEQNLYSIYYHHEGGDHYWYIIPISERQALQKIFDQKNSSICFNHGKLFLDPSVLDQYHIRYHRIVQCSNQFVVLSAGTLAQSFAKDASWSESVNFALPSWIEQGYATLPHYPCQCDIRPNSLLKTIDINLFRHELIQKYINSYINISTNEKSLSFEDSSGSSVIPIPNVDSNATNSSNERTLSRNIQPKVVLQSIVVDIQSPLTSSTTTYSFDEDRTTTDDDHLQVKSKLLEENIFGDLSDRQTLDTPMIDSISSDYLSDLNSPTTNQVCQTSSTATDIYAHVTNNGDIDNHLISFEELMDILPSTSDNMLSTHGQNNGNFNMSNPSTLPSNTHTVVTNERTHIKKERAMNQTINNCKTLFVSGLRDDVKLKVIRHYFTDCIKVIIKPHRTTPQLKYAFIIFRTSRDAKRNLRRPIDHYILGPDCRIEYARRRSSPSNNQQDSNQNKVRVGQIPENVTKNDLSHLFSNCHILEYCPARTLYTEDTTTKMKDNSRFLSGYAILLYDNELEAASIIRHADQYHINGQPLVVTLYHNKKIPPTRRKQLSGN